MPDKLGKVWHRAKDALHRHTPGQSPEVPSAPSPWTTQTPSRSPPSSPEPTSIPTPNARRPPKRVSTILPGLNKLAGALEGSIKFGPLTNALNLLQNCFEIPQGDSHNLQEYTALKAKLNSLCEDLSAYMDSASSLTMTPVIENIANGIKHEAESILHPNPIRKFSRVTEVKADMDERLACYRRVQTHLERLTMNLNFGIWKTLDEHSTDVRLKSLPISPIAQHRSAPSAGLGRVSCTPNTRVEVLGQIMKWANDSTSEKVYWLNGMAGTGKTAIACSLCDELERDTRLGASFFCSRRLPLCRDASRIVPSISHQLSSFSRPFRLALSQVLELSPEAHNRPLAEQFQKLIVAPLLEVADSFSTNTVIVIDALDECEQGESGELVEVLLSAPPTIPVKFFVASRPAAQIVDQMRNQASEGCRLVLRLHDLERTIVQEDIKTYLRTALEPANVTESDLDILAARSGVWFIYAATVARYITSDNYARCRKRLQQILHAPSTGTDGTQEVDDLYTLILSGAFNDKGLNESDRQEMTLIVHTVVCAQEPLPLCALSELLGLDLEMSIKSALRPLLSVLKVVEFGGLFFASTLHESFPNYIFDPARSGEFCCEVLEHNTKMTLLCLNRIKSQRPAFNICGLESSYVLDESVPDLNARVYTSISYALYYSCRFWGVHLRRSILNDETTFALRDFLAVRLLLWMEVVNLKGIIRDGTKELHRVQAWCKRAECPVEIERLAQDAWQFTDAFSSSPAVKSTPHIYVSTLTFWPKQQPMSICYASRAPGLTGLAGTAMVKRGNEPFTTCNIGAMVCTVACSPTGTHVVSASADGLIRTWDIHTGQEVTMPQAPHVHSIKSLAFLPDGTRFVSGSSNGMMHIWDMITCQTLSSSANDSIGEICAMACSPDGANIAVGSQNSVIHIWDACNGQCVGLPFAGHTGGVYSVAYSPDGTYLVSGSSDQTMRIWDVCKSSLAAGPYSSHTGAINSVAYSPDGLHIASGSADGTIKVWRTTPSRQSWRQVVSIGPYHHLVRPGPVYSVAFSPNSAYIVSGSDSHVVCVWDSHSGQLVGKFEGHTDTVNAVTYSPNGRNIISASSDGTVRIWDTISQSIPDEPFQGHAGSILSITYSQDSKLLVSSADDCTICVWDAHTGHIVGEPLSSGDDLLSLVVFSPDSKYVVSAKTDNVVLRWDIGASRLANKVQLRAYAGKIQSIACCPENVYLACGYDDNIIRIWVISTGQLFLPPLDQHATRITSVSYSPNGVHIVSSSDDGAIYIWDAHSGAQVGRPSEGCHSNISSVQYSLDGNRIVSVSAGCNIHVWDLASNKTTGYRFNPNDEELSSIAHSADGTLIALGFSDGHISIVDTATSKTLGAQLRGHDFPVTKMALSPDGSSLASISRDNLIRIWSITRLKQDVNLGEEAVRRTNQDDWRLDKDGWVLNQDDHPLIWVPRDLRNALLRPHNISAISQTGTLQLDFTNSKLGDMWCKCFRFEDTIPAGTWTLFDPGVGGLFCTAVPAEITNDRRSIRSVVGDWIWRNTGSGWSWRTIVSRHLIVVVLAVVVRCLVRLTAGDVLWN